jgi:hypothetical protein
VSLEVGRPLHGCGIRAHRRIADHLGIAGHAGESVAALTQQDHLSLRIGIDNARHLGDVWRPRRHRAYDLGFHRLGNFGGGRNKQHSQKTDQEPHTAASSCCGNRKRI